MGQNGSKLAKMGQKMGQNGQKMGQRAGVDESINFECCSTSQIRFVIFLKTKSI